MRRTIVGATLALAPAIALASTNACTITSVVEPSAEAGAPTPAEAGKPDVGPEEGFDATQPCRNQVNHTPIDATKFPWKPPSQAAGSCAEADLASLIALVDKGGDPRTWPGGTWTTNEVCRSCVFAKETATWPPMRLDAAGKAFDLNVGGCIAIASGIDACGKAYHQWRECFREACAVSDECAGGYSSCVSTANKYQCKQAFDAIVPACEGVPTIAAAETACHGDKYPFEGPIRAQCIGLPDGGM